MKPSYIEELWSNKHVDYIPRPSKGVKFQPPGLFLVVKGAHILDPWRIQVNRYNIGMKKHSKTVDLA